MSIHDWLKRHSNYSASHENYEPYIDHQKHLILLGQYNGNYYVQDVASLDAFEAYYHESYITNVI